MNSDQRMSDARKAELRLLARYDVVHTVGGQPADYRAALAEALDALDAAEALSQERRNSLTREIAHKQLAMAERDSYKSDAHALSSLAAQCEAQWPEPGKTAAEIVTGAFAEVSRLRASRAAEGERSPDAALEQKWIDAEARASEGARDTLRLLRLGKALESGKRYVDAHDARRDVNERALALAKGGT